MSLENRNEKAAPVDKEAADACRALADDSNQAFNKQFADADACKAKLNDPNEFNTLDKLSHASKQELDYLYNHASAGKIPQGDTKGIPLVAETWSHGGAVLDAIAGVAWKGKTFDANGDLNNKVLGGNWFNAHAEQAPSYKDSSSSVVLDYQKGAKTTSDNITSWIRDEIREVRPGIYLGQLHNQANWLPIPKDVNIAYFALDNNHKR